ncbi:hypothetical protein Caci_8554 [Catenulispora acidiphila DSM 44928]|uniref:Uncharacterized protein n=1 Tax=Catenulispora acidiphila (strain DSM 44928 / JCM 14897 / NBRC 102108 / NRRL B-24433 / ID139908) TaxID=479433 RepID=C7PYQ2_CATAD|nr:hypothetical protein [Catenulispora acidiphila]ACU77374.1 hypothetical protein Caci_8554 [Catenulispora acidiphila DSM 44928]
MDDRQRFDLNELIEHLASDDHTDDAPDLSGGQRIEYVVNRIRGALVDCHAVLDPTTTDVNSAASLARLLKIDPESLLGTRYSCQVIQAEHGNFKTDFRLVTSDDSSAG